MLLVLSGLFGVVLGITTATYQAPLETAHVLMGWVSYDQSSPIYATHIAIFTLTNYVLLAFLALTGSEAATSIIVCAILGMLALQSLAVLIFVGVRNAYLAALSSIVAGIINLFGYGIAYPIIFLGSSHSYGRAGLSITILAVALFVFSRFRLGFFLCGFTLVVHPPWGAWIGICLLLVLVTGYRYLKPLVNSANLLAYASGAGISALALLLHRLRYPLPAETGSGTGIGRELFYNYVQYWDYHRQKFTHMGSLHRELTYAAVALLISIYMFRRAGASLGEKLFAHFMIVATLAGAVFIFVPSWFPPDAFPGALIALMPGRFVNIAFFAGLPLLLGFMLRDRKTVPSLVIVAAIWTFMMYIRRFIPLEIPIGYRELGLMLTAVVLFTLPAAARKKIQGARDHYGITNRLLGLAVLVVIASAPFYLVLKAPQVRQKFARPALPPVKQKVLTTDENYQLQAYARVPTLTPLLDAFNHSGESSLIEVDRMLRDIYGVSLADSPPRSRNLHRGMVITEDYAEMWAARTCNEWERLSKAYEFDLIVVPNTMNLRLPRADTETYWHTYRPSCSVAPQ